LVAGSGDDTCLFRLGVRLGMTGMKAEPIVERLLSRLCSKLGTFATLALSEASWCKLFHHPDLIPILSQEGKLYEGTSTECQTFP
jgi:hypothetical protein